MWGLLAQVGLCFVASFAEGGLQKGGFFELISWVFLAVMGFAWAACPIEGEFTSSAQII